MPREKPKKSELARFRVLQELGHTPNAIGNITGRDPKTVRKWLQSEVYQDPELQKLIDIIKNKEVEQLTLITGKARAVLEQYLNDVLMGNKEPNPISVTAIMDRAFQQVRILEGKSTANISIHSHVQEATKILNELKASLNDKLSKTPGGGKAEK